MLRRFIDNEQANIAIVLVLAVPILLGVLLLAIDSTRSQSTYSNNQGAVDAAVLLAADHITSYRIKNDTKDSPGDIREYILEQYLTNIENDQNYFELDEDSFEIEVVTNRVRVRACVNSENDFASPLGLDSKTTRVCNDAEASIPTVGHIEIALALDVTSSMLEEVYVDGREMTKIDALKQALVGEHGEGGLLNKEVVQDSAVEGGIYWSVIPFRGMVDLGTNARNIVGNDWNDNAIRDDKSEYEYDDREYANITRMRTNRSDVGWDLYERAASGDRAAADRFVSGGWPNKWRHVYTDIDDPDGVKEYYHDDAEYLLGRVALTERMSGNNSLADDYAPRGNDKFKAYWHHPRKYWMSFYQHSSGIKYYGNCTQCRAIGTWAGPKQCPSDFECPPEPEEEDPGPDEGGGNNNGGGNNGNTGGTTTPPPPAPSWPSMDNK